MLGLRKMTALEKKFFFKNMFQIIFGSISLAFGTALFLTRLNIVAGGLSGIAIILQFFIGDKFFGGQSIDIIVFILTWTLWVLGLITIGKKFALKTLISSIVYPLALSLFLRVPAFISASKMIAEYGMKFLPAGADVPIGNLLICGIFGGVFIGVGVAFNFAGGGSTGGVDVFIAMANKYLGIRESIASFVLDAAVILCGMFVIPSNIVPSLCGIISACVTALMIEYFYNASQSSYQADIISSNWEEISAEVQNILGRGATIINAEGGYKGDKRVILRVVFDKTQYKAIREIIAKIDPKAFMTFTQTYGVYGEGFKANEVPQKIIQKKATKKKK